LRLRQIAASVIFIQEWFVLNALGEFKGIVGDGAAKRLEVVGCF
jgi:hypothetical protein